MIDEKKLIMYLSDWQLSEAYDGNEKVYNTIEQCIKGVEEQPKVGEWIPIGQYPSEPSLLCFEDGDILVGFYDYDYDEWTLKSRNDEYDLVLQDGEEPIAYMPLPQPYKGE